MNNKPTGTTMKFSRKIRTLAYFALVIACSSSQVTAQKTTNLGDEQINVVKAYQPTLSDAFKISDVPGRDTAVSYAPVMKYEINPVQFPTIYTISPIKPLRIKDENIKKLYRGFVKGGYGTKNTPYAEIFYNSLRSKSFDAGVHLNYLSSSGSIKGYGFPGMSESGIKVFGTKFFDSSLLRGELGYNRSVYHWYGYNNPPDILSKSETKHSFDDAFGKFTLASNHRDDERLRYSGGIDFYLFNDNNSNDETNFAFRGSVGETINDLDIKADFDLDFLKYDNKTYKPDDRNIIRLDPRIGKKFDRLNLSAGANIAIEINELTKYHLYPHVRIDYAVVDDMMSIFGQLTGNLQRNSFRSFSKENPFLGRDFQLQNTNNKFDLSAGLNVKLDRQLAFIGIVGLKQLNDDAFFRNVDTTNSLVVYDVMYDNNKQANIHAEIVYDQNDKTVWSITADYNSNKPSREDKALFRPDFRFGLNGTYNMADKIYIGTQWSYVSSRYAKNYAPGGDYLTLKGFIDGNISIDYRYSKVMSLFLHINNITASSYSRWYNYPSYGFGAIAGLTYSF